MIPPRTLAFSSRRLETLPQAGDVMAAHEHFIMEAPPTPEGGQMPAGCLALEDYLQPAA